MISFYNTHISALEWFNETIFDRESEIQSLDNIPGPLMQ